MRRARPRIVVAHWKGLDLFDEEALHRIDQVGELIDRDPISAWDDPRADQLLAQADVILGHWGCPPLDAEMLGRSPELGLLAYAAGTVKGVVTNALWDRHIRVTSGARANAEPVAEYTLATILFANKQVFWRMAGSGSREGTPPGPEPGNYHKTVGIIGASLIGRRVIELLAQFPHLKVTLYDPFVSAGEAAALGATKLELAELCAACDILSIHAPALPSTRHMIGALELATLCDGATVINTARGSLLDHEALIAEARTGRLNAVLDVTEPEPLPEDSPLRSLPNVVLTPHLAGSQGTEIGRMADHVIEEIRRWSLGEPALNEITRDQLDRIA